MVRALDREADLPCALLVLFQPRAQTIQQAAQRGHNIVGFADGFRQRHPHGVGGCRHGGIDGFRLKPEHLIQPPHQARSEAPRQRTARHVGNVSNGPQPKAMEAQHGVFFDPQGCDGQRRDSLAGFACGRDSGRSEPGQRPCCASCVRDACPHCQAGFAELADDLAQHVRFAAKKMRAAGDVENQAVGRIDRGPRRIAQPPAQQRVQKRAVLLGRCIDTGQIRKNRAHVGQRCALLYPCRLSHRVDRAEPQGALLLRDHCEWTRRVVRPVAP